MFLVHVIPYRIRALQTRAIVESLRGAAGSVCNSGEGDAIPVISADVLLHLTKLEHAFFEDGFHEGFNRSVVGRVSGRKMRVNLHRPAATRLRAVAGGGSRAAWGAGHVVDRQRGSCDACNGSAVYRSAIKCCGRDARYKNGRTVHQASAGGCANGRGVAGAISCDTRNRDGSDEIVTFAAVVQSAHGADAGRTRCSSLPSNAVVRTAACVRCANWIACVD